jgi:hypothetical protein
VLNIKNEAFLYKDVWSVGGADRKRRIEISLFLLIVKTRFHRIKHFYLFIFVEVILCTELKDNIKFVCFSETRNSILLFNLLATSFGH